MILIARRRILEHALHLADSASDELVHGMAAAKDLVEKRDRWLNPEGASEAELKKRALTNVCNQPPTWLDLAHNKLDNAVLDAYAWPHDITNNQILEHLLALNLKRATGASARQA